MAKQPESKEEPLAEEPSVACEFVHSLPEEDYSGQGGSFVFDSSTGALNVLEQTKPATTN